MTKAPAKPKRPPLTARTADRHELYQNSVQDPEHEIWFLNRVYKDAFGDSAALLREDFAGTAAVAAAWVRRRPQRSAIAVDLDPGPFEWAGPRHLAALTEAERSRLSLLCEDVRKVTGAKADVVAAQNFSFNCFKQEADLLAYFKAAFKNLKSRGVFVVDMMGGWALHKGPQRDIHRKAGFTYIWEQRSFDPITHHCLFHIHFAFKDGSVLRKAFTYDWRLWSIPEVTSLMKQAGFSRTEIYWEGEDETGRGNNIFTRRTKGTPDECWLAYVVGVKE